MKRSPMKRPKARGWNSTLRPRSKKREAYLESSGYRERSQAAIGKPCAIASPVCTKRSEGIHHLLPRGRAGGLKAAESAPTAYACNACNEWVGLHPREARKMGLLMKWSDWNITS